MTEKPDVDVEQLVREGLRHRAAEMPVSAAVVGRARAGFRRRRAARLSVGAGVQDAGGLDSSPGPPGAPYMWLGAAVEVGTVNLGYGYVQETVEVHGSTLTVATRDRVLRQRILASASRGETCSPALRAAPRVVEMATEGVDELTAMRVCAYRPADSRGWELVYAAEVGAAAGERFRTAAVAARGVDYKCVGDGRDREYVVLTLTGDDPYGAAPINVDMVVDVGCPRTETTPDEYAVLSEATVRPWAVGGIPAVLYGPSGGKGAMIDVFIGSQG